MTVTRLQVENLHRDMIWASNEVYSADQQLQSAVAKGNGLHALLRPWRNAARRLADGLGHSRATLLRDGNPPALLGQIERRLNDLLQRAETLDVNTELDESVKSWEQLAFELVHLRGVRGNYLVSLLWSKKPDIDRATTQLSAARKQGGLASEEYQKQRGLTDERDAKQKKYDDLRQKYLAAQQDLRTLEGKQANEARAAGAKEQTTGKAPIPGMLAGKAPIIIKVDRAASTQAAPSGKQAPQSSNVGSGGKAAPQGSSSSRSPGSAGRARPQQASQASAPRGSTASRSLPSLAAITGGSSTGQSTSAPSGKTAPASGGGVGGGGKQAPQSAAQQAQSSTQSSTPRTTGAHVHGAGTVAGQISSALGTPAASGAGSHLSSPGSFMTSAGQSGQSGTGKTAPQGMGTESANGGGKAAPAGASSRGKATPRQAGRPGASTNAINATNAGRLAVDKRVTQVGSPSVGFKFSNGEGHGDLAFKFEKRFPEAGAYPPNSSSSSHRGGSVSVQVRLSETHRPDVVASSGGGAGVYLASVSITVGFKLKAGAFLKDQLALVEAMDAQVRKVHAGTDGLQAALRQALTAPLSWMTQKATSAVEAAEARERGQSSVQNRPQLQTTQSHRPGLPLANQLFAGQRPPPSVRPGIAARPGQARELQIEKLNLSFAQTLERARSIGVIAKYQTIGVAERDGVAERLHKTFAAMSQASSRAMTDGQGGEIRTALARMDVMLGKLKGKRGGELASGAQEVSQLIGQLGSLSGGRSDKLRDIKNLLSDRAKELSTLAKNVKGNAAEAIYQAGGLRQPSAYAGGHQLDQLKKLYPGIDRLLRGASATDLEKQLKAGGGKGVKGLIQLFEGKHAGQLGQALGGGKGPLGMLGHGLPGSSMLGKLQGGGHLGGLGGGGFVGGLGSFGAGGLAKAMHDARTIAKKHGVSDKDLQKVMQALQKGDSGALGKLGHELAGKPHKKWSGKISKHGIAAAFAARGRGSFGKQFESGPLGAMLDCTQRSHGMGLGGLASHFLQTTGHSRVSQAVATFEGLLKQGHVPRFSLWGSLTKAVSSAASRVGSAVSSVTKKASALAQATARNVSSGISSFGGRALAFAQGVGQRVQGVVGRAVQSGMTVARSVAGKVMGVASTIGGKITQGARRLYHAAETGFDQLKEGASNVWSAGKNAASSLWDNAKNIGASAWEMAKEKGLATWQSAKDVGSMAWKTAQRGGSAVWNMGKRVSSAAMSGIQQGASWLGDKVSGLAQAAWSTAGKGWGALKDVASSGANWVKDKASGAAAWASQKIGSAWQGIKSGVSGAWSGVKEGVGAAFDKAKSGASGAWGWIKNTAKSAGSFIGEKVKGGLEWINKTGIVGGLGGMLKKGVSFLGKVAQHTPLGFLAKKGFDFAKSGGLGKLWNGAKNLAKSAWGGIKKGYGKVKEFAQSDLGQGIITGLSLAASFIPGGMLVKGLIGAGIGAITAMSEGKNWKQVLLAAGSGALTGALPFMKIGPLAKIGAGALTGAASAVMSGGNWKDALKGAAGGALDSVDLGALKKVKGISAVGKLLKGGKLSKLEKVAVGGSKVFGALQKTLANPKVRKTIGALERVASKGVKGGIWLSGKAAKAQSLLDKALEMGGKVNGVLETISEQAPQYAEMFGGDDTALGRLIGKTGALAGQGHEKLGTAIEWGQTGSEKLSTYRGYLDKGLNFMGVKDPQKAYDKMMARKGARRGNLGSIKADASFRLEKHNAKEARKHRGSKHVSGGLEKNHELNPPAAHDLADAVKPKRKRAAKGKNTRRGMDAGEEHDEVGHKTRKARNKRAAHKQVSLLEKAIAKGKELKRKGQKLAQFGYEKLGVAEEYLSRGMEGVDKIQHGLEQASKLAKQGAHFLGDDTELGQFLLSVHAKAGEVHGYLEQGLGYAEKVRSRVKSAHEYLDGLEGVGEDFEPDAHGKKRRRKKAKEPHAKGLLFEDEADSKGKKVKTTKGAGHPDAKGGKAGASAHETEAQRKARGKKAWDLLSQVSSGVQRFESHFAKTMPEIHKALAAANSQKASTELMGLGSECESINRLVREASAAAKGFNTPGSDYEGEAKFYADWHKGTKAKLYKMMSEIKGICDHAAISGFGIDEKTHGDIFANHKHIFGIRTKMIAFGESLGDPDAKEHVEALLKDAKLAKATLQSLKSKYKKDKAAYAFLTDFGRQDQLIDSAIHTIEAGLKGAHEETANEGNGKTQPGGKREPKRRAKKHSLLDRMKHGLALANKYKKRAKKFGGKVSKFLGKAERMTGKGLALGQKISAGLEKAHHYAGLIEKFFGSDSGIGEFAHQAGEYAEKGHEKLGQALDLGKKGKAGLHKGKELLDLVLGHAHKHHVDKEQGEDEEAKKEGAKITDELAKGAEAQAKHEHAEQMKRQGRRGHPHAHADHGRREYRGHPISAHQAHEAQPHGAHGPHGLRGRPGRGRGFLRHRPSHHEALAVEAQAHAPQHHADPGKALHKAAKEIERFSKAANHGIVDVEKLMSAGKSDAAVKKIRAVSALAERARMALAQAVAAAKGHPGFAKHLSELRKTYLAVRGHFFKFVSSLHGLAGKLGEVDLSKYPDIAQLSSDADTLATKVAALGDGKHADSPMQGIVEKLRIEGAALLSRALGIRKKYVKDDAATHALDAVVAKLQASYQTLVAHGDPKAIAKGDKDLGLPKEDGGGAEGSSQTMPGKHRARRRKRRARGKGQGGRGRGHRGKKLHPEIERVLVGGDSRVHVDKGPNRGGADHAEEQDVDPAAQDTWLGSGQGLMLFSEVFGGFLPGGAEQPSEGSGGDSGGGETGGDGEVVHHDGGADDEGGEEDADDGAGGEEEDHGGEEEEPGEGGDEEPHHGGGKRPPKKRRHKRRGPHRGKRGKRGGLGKLWGKAKRWLGKSKLGRMGLGLLNKGKQFFSKMFGKLHGFSDKIGSLAKFGQKWLGKGMHFAQVGMGFLNKVTSGASKVAEFAGKAEGFLDKLGMHKLAGFAGKIGGAADWVGEKSEAGHGMLKTANEWMGKGKKGLKSVENFTKKASKALGQAEHFKLGGLLNLFKASKRGNGLDGKLTTDRVRMGSVGMDSAKQLDGTTLSKMERFLGGSFNGVKIHTGMGAAEVTKRYGAEAVTVKDHIFFAPGRFNPDSLEGQKLLAHELTHVLQKGRSNLDVRTAEAEALRSEHSYGAGPNMQTLNLGQPKADFSFGDGMGAGASGGIHTAKRTRSKGHASGAKDAPPDGEEFLDLVAARVHELLMEEMEIAFESR